MSILNYMDCLDPRPRNIWGIDVQVESFMIVVRLQNFGFPIHHGQQVRAPRVDRVTGAR